MQFQSRTSSSSDPTTALIPRSSSASVRKFLTKSVVLILLMKLSGNALQFQLVNFNTEDYGTDPNDTSICTAVPFKPQGNAYTGSVPALIAAATFLLPSLGGILSDKYFGCVKVLTYGAIIQFWVSVLFPLLIQLSIICHNKIWFYILTGGLTIAMGLVDPLLVFGLLQNVSGSQSRRVLLFAYFICAASSEMLGNIPSILRYAFRHSITTQSFEFVGVPFTALLVLSLFLLSSDGTACEKLKNDTFRFPTMRRFRMYYIIVTAFVPFASVIILCRNVFYWTEMKYYLKDDDGFISATIVSVGYQLGTIVFSVCGIVLLLNERFPKQLTIGVRLRCGLLLMMSSKVTLFVVSFYHARMSHLGQSHPSALQSIYFAAAFIDGAANALTDVATYELVDCIAERCAKAMYIGIFFTTWGMGVLVTGIVVMLVRLLPSEGPQLMPEGGVQPQFYIRYSIVIFLLLLSYGYYAKVSLPLAEPLVLINSEQHDEQDEHDEQPSAPYEPLEFLL